MPFPPAFDRAWDETFPPDTQLANLLGSDVRNFKVDIRQRVSLLSGTLANRPTPDASWGGVGFGMVYFSTDTSQIFQWSGTAWVDITSTFQKRLVDSNSVTINAPAVVTTGNQVTIPGGTLKVGSIVDIDARIRKTAGTGGTVQSLLFGGTTFSGAGNAVIVPGVFWMHASIYVLTPTTQRTLSTFVVTNIPDALIIGAPYADPAENVANPIVVQTQSAAGGDSFVHDLLIVSIRP